MNRDPRGGHNRKKVDENFFKSWSPKMAYVLGLICADGAVEDVRESSRTCYLQISSIDKDLLTQVQKCLGSSHKLYLRKAEHVIIKGKIFFRSDIYNLRIGNKVIFQDLIDLGVTPRKSLRLQLPPVPDIYFNYFLRGYFDGDGCVNIYTQKNRPHLFLQVIFTSGCKSFLEKISSKLFDFLQVQSKVGFYSGAYRLSYKTKQCLKVLAYMYKSLNLVPFLGRKYKIYYNYGSRHVNI